MSHHPAAAVDTDEQQQQQPQCRICLDGPDPDLGRLIRPCLCSGTVSVRQAFPTVPARTNPLTESLSLKHIRIVRAPRVPPALEEYLCQYLCIFCLSAMPLPLPLFPYQDSWPGYQPRFVLRPTHITPLHSRFVRLPQSLTHRPGSSCDRDVIHSPVHGNRLCIVLPDDHLAFLIGRPFLLLLWFVRHLCCLGRRLLDLDESVHCWA